MNDRTQTLAIEHIEDLVERARALTVAGERRILGISGAPGAGKSTISAAVIAALGDQVALVGMDGFHLSNSELVRRGKRDRKGAHDTFDVEGYVAMLARLRRQRRGTIFAPVFDRAIEESIAAAVSVSAQTPLVITEGNYLLCTGGGWGRARQYFDETWFIDVPPQERDMRLIERRMRGGESRATAEGWVRDVDRPNGDFVERTQGRADLIVRLKDGT